MCFYVSCQADTIVPRGAAMLECVVDAKIVVSEDLDGFDCWITSWEMRKVNFLLFSFFGWFSNNQWRSIEIKVKPIIFDGLNYQKPTNKCQQVLLRLVAERAAGCRKEWTAKVILRMVANWCLEHSNTCSCTDLHVQIWNLPVSKWTRGSFVNESRQTDEWRHRDLCGPDCKKRDRFFFAWLASKTICDCWTFVSEKKKQCRLNLKSRLRMRKKPCEPSLVFRCEGDWSPCSPGPPGPLGPPGPWEVEQTGPACFPHQEPV